MISVIIQIYNTPVDFLDRCLYSIDNQEFLEYEVIIVDDGSTEENYNEYKKLTLKYTNIKLIRKENAGVSAARNTGINNAVGQYLTFVDADDVIDKNFLSQASDIINLYNSDIVIGTIEYVPAKNILQGNNELTFIKGNEIASLKKALLQIHQETFIYPILGTPCGRLYKTEIAKKVLFPVGITHWEDQIFNRKYFDIIESAVFIPNCWYYYYQNDFSAMHANFNNNYIEKSIPFWNMWEDMNENENDSSLKKALRIRSIDYYYSAIHQYVLYADCNYKIKRQTMLKLLDEKIFKNSLNNLTLKNLDSNYDKIRFYLMSRKYIDLIYSILKIKTFLSSRDK